MPDLVAALIDAARAAPLWALALLALATLVSEDLACISAGLLVGEGAVSFLGATLACFTGILIGDLLLVVLGRILGRPALERAPLRWWVAREQVERAERWIGRRGGRLALASRFLPGTRLPTFVAIGMLRAPLASFIGWFALACALWTPLLVGFAAVFGLAARRLLDTWSALAPVVIVAGVLAWITLRLGVAASTWRGRRLLLGRWRRLTRWEFWPTWAVYAPFALYLGWLALRYRSLTLPSIVNPGMECASGLCGESKARILAALAGAGDRIARWELIPPESPERRLDALRTFMVRHGLGYPVVLKPDIGERGRGVVIARDEHSALQALASAPTLPLIAQAYVPGIEFGIFYHRAPSAPRGTIFAITDKRMVSVTGDGRNTLEHLILADDRAVCMAPFFLRTLADRLDDVPAAGEAVYLTELGTHCRGALFLDGTHLATEALLDAVDRVSRAFPGFHFGRYDVRTPSVDALQAGEFTVIELNGLSSEATSIYDPRHSVWTGWRTLARQWRTAWAIARENRALGAKPLSLRAVWRLVVAYQEVA